MPSPSPERGTRGMARRAEKGMPHGLFPAGESLELSSGERETLRLLADTIVPRTGDPREPQGGSASDLGVDALIAQAIRNHPRAGEAASTVDTDLAVIGSGAGGAVIAAQAAEAGHRVLVIEAGALLTPDTFTQRELPGTDGMLERHGLMTTKDFTFGVLHGRIAGGGTTVNWMTCLRPPPWALEEGERVYGIPGLTGPGFQACIDEVWGRLGVTTGESVLTPPSEVLRRGCLALGYEEGRDFHVTAKNARGCENRCDYCNFGCIYSAKQSTLATSLPDAARHGARFLFDTEARTISTRTGGTTAEAVHRSDGRERRLEIRAKVVVVAAGGIQTPALLLRSGFRHPGIGRGLRLDPP